MRKADETEKLQHEGDEQTIKLQRKPASKQMAATSADAYLYMQLYSCTQSLAQSKAQPHIPALALKSMYKL